MKNKIISPVGDSWDAYKETLLTPEERAEIAVKASLVAELVNARHETGLTQKQLEIVSGVKQPVIARLEKGSTDPQLSTLIKLLASLGKTLAIVSLKGKSTEKRINTKKVILQTALKE